MSVKTSEVYRCLEKKALVLGFEVVDLFIAFSMLSALNLIFKHVPFKVFLTWVPSIALALFLRLSKAGKPENYLVHLLRYHFSPGILSAFPLAGRRTRFIGTAVSNDGVLK